MFRVGTLLLLFFISTISSANKLCPEAETTRAIADCLIGLSQQADEQMQHYLSEAKARHNDDKKLIELIDVSQKAWLDYQESHCSAVYQYWHDGSIRFIMHPQCLIYTTKARSYDIWREYLTYSDSTPPILPEPVLQLYRR